MSNKLMEKLSKIVAEGGARAESEIKRRAKKVDPTDAARDYFIEKINENIAVWKAINADEELPVHKYETIDKKTGMKKTRKYSKWFKKNEDKDTYELTPCYGLRPIKNFFGDGLQTYVGIKDKELLPLLEALKESAETNELDELLLMAREEAKVNRAGKKL